MSSPAVLVKPLGVKVDSTATVYVRYRFMLSDLTFIEGLVACHNLVRRHANGYTYHLYGARADLEEAVAKWNRRILSEKC